MEGERTVPASCPDHCPNYPLPLMFVDNDTGGSPTGNTNQLTWVKPCDLCGVPGASQVYFHDNAGYLCTTWDTRVRIANRVPMCHEKVLVCEACEQAPAVLACCADAAILCAACDVLVHSANKLAGRHERIPIFPSPSIFPTDTHNGTMNAVKENNKKDIEVLYGEEMNKYLDLVELDSCYKFLDDVNQERMMMPSHVMTSVKASTAEASTATYSYAGSMRHRVPFSSLEASVVPDTAITDISNSQILALNGILDPILAPAFPMLDLNAIDREARVMRYKEKKSLRKFEKTVRYASRKAYAEARPRIKGRFIKRSDKEIEVDEIFSPTSPSALSDQNYMDMSWY